MHILLTGGTGLIGQALCRYWTNQGHKLWVLSRRPNQVASLCGANVIGIADLGAIEEQSLDAVINLAGAPIADRPWTKARRTLLWDSRVRYTEQLVQGLAQRRHKPKVLISGSAVGWYGDGGERLLAEDQPAGTDFASQLCVAWEDAASEASIHDIRVALVRTGLVLAPKGGFLARLLPLFRLGLGGPLGTGQQWMPWIHLQDQVALIDFILHHPEMAGPYNACAPHPVRNKDFCKTLGQVLHRPAVLSAPAWALRLGLGDLSGLLLGGQHAVPARTQAAGFRFHFTDLEPALCDLLQSH